VSVLRQEALLRTAMKERGELLPYRIDHENGTARVDGRTVGLVHPDSFFETSRPLLDTPKTLGFYFAGYFVPAGGRREMLSRWRGAHGAVIVQSSEGRKPNHKGSWHPAYYEPLASAEFGLCPHHTNWRGPRETMWTYRFVDCCLVGTIPLLFRATPLGEEFTRGFRFAWDDDEAFAYRPEDAAHNRALAEERFRL
jgi:hypothetical protein